MKTKKKTTQNASFKKEKIHSQLSVLLAIGSLLANEAVLAQSSFIDLGTLNSSMDFSVANAISADGSVVAGISGGFDVSVNSRAFIWTQAGGMVSLGSLNNGLNSEAYGISADGTVVVGRANDGNLANAYRAFRWTKANGMASLGALNDASYSVAYGVSADGRVVVGVAGDSNFEDRAFRWTERTGMTSLGGLANGSASYAYATSADGSVVVGVAGTDAPSQCLHVPCLGNRAFRWTETTGMISLGTLTGGISSYANGISADGSVVVGSSDIGKAQAWQAFRWTPAYGMVSLGLLNNGYSSQAFGVSADGLVVVGSASDGNAGGIVRGFRWTRETGMQTIESWLRSNGVRLPEDVTQVAQATNFNGSVVTGTLANNHAYIARVSDIGNGIITLSDMQESLGIAGNGAYLVSRVSETLLHGAHGQPLMRQVGEGKTTMWLAGDSVLDDHILRNGAHGLAELGLGHNFGLAQINASIGQTWARLDFSHSGQGKTDGNFLLIEALIPVSGCLWATLGGYDQRGEAKLRRGYLNGEELNISTGSTNTRTRGLRARMDWGDVFKIASTSFTPYADLSYSVTNIDAYMETGGGFPARFDSRREPSTVFKLGLNTVTFESDQLKLLGILEASHRFEQESARTSGQLIGLFGFDLPSQPNKRNWLRIGIGAEGKFAGGNASIMLNRTSKGETPSSWLSANWQIVF